MDPRTPTWENLESHLTAAKKAFAEDGTIRNLAAWKQALAIAKEAALDAKLDDNEKARRVALLSHHNTASDSYQHLAMQTLFGGAKGSPENIATPVAPTNYNWCSWLRNCRKEPQKEDSSQPAKPLLQPFSRT